MINLDPLEEVAQETLQTGLKEALAYKYALEQSCIVAITNQKGIIQYANDNFCQISKYSRQELIGQDHRIINSGFHPKDFICDLWLTIASGKIWRGELKNKAKDGSYYWVDTTIVPFLNARREPYQYVAIRADITARKNAEEEVIRVYKEKETALNRISDSVVSLDNDWRYTFLNDAALATHILGKDETIGKVIWDVHPEMKGTIFWDKYHEAMLTRKVVEIENYYAPMDIWFSVKVYPSLDGLTIFYKNITESKKAEQELSQTLREVTDYKFALDEANIVAITDQKGIIKYVNDNFCKISKYQREELIGQDHRIINSGYHSKEFIKNIWTTIAHGNVWRGEIKNRAKDGSYYWVDTTIVPFLTDLGKPFQYVAIRADITQRKIAEQDLQVAHERLLFHIENTTFGFIEWDNQLHIKSLSKRAEQIFEWNLKEFSANERNGYGQVFYEDLSLANRIAEDLITGAVERNNIQHRNITKSGKVIWCEWFNSVLKDKDGKVCTIMSLVQDITQRKQAEENLIKSEARLKEAQAISHLGNWELNFGTQEAIWSEEACRIYMLSPEEEKNQNYETWLSFIHPEDLDSVMAAINQSQKTLSNTILNHRIILKNGTVKYIQGESKFEFDQYGKLIGLYGIAHDVTEKRLAEEDLRQSESSLKVAQAIAHLGNWEIDLVNNVQNWSDEMCKLFGMTREDARPSTELFLSFIHPDEINYVKGQVENAFKTLENASFDFKWIRKDGVERYGYSEWRFEFDKNDNPIFLFGIIQDVTERKLAELERIKIVDDLILRNKDLEQFAYIVSHNLRAPVANILGASSVLSDPGLSDEEKNVLNEGLTASVTKLDNVVNDLRDILQVKREINETKEKVLFSKLVDNIIVSIKNLIEKDNIEIKYDFSEIDEILTLKSYLHSIFYNLISNSIKYRQQQVRSLIEIKSHRVNNMIKLVFTDNGMGIDLQKKGDQVFGLYKRFHTTIEGKGMGLFMVKTQVETLGGKISINSEVNKGTTFTIEFQK